MITEDCVSFETAKLLKEKGFSEKCQKVYMHNGQLLWAQIFMEGESFVDNKCIELVADYNNRITYTQGEYAYLCPTLQMVMKWLREVHNVFVDISSRFSENADKDVCFSYSCKKLIDTYKSSYEVGDGEWLNYEEACEAAIKYCIKNLV